MRRLFSCYLLQKRPPDRASQGRRAAFWLWNGLLLAGAAVVLGMFSLLMAPGQYGWALLPDYFSHPALMVLNLLPTVVLALFLYGVTGRTWLAYLITALPVIGLSAGNTYKLLFRDDPVLAADLLLLGEAGNMAGKYQLFLFNKLIFAVWGAVLSTLLLALLAQGRPRGKFRAATAGIALLCALALAPVYGSDSVYNKNSNAEHIDKWSSTQQYISRGLIYPFLHSVKAAFPSPPEGYSEREAAALLAQYEDAVIPEDKKVNIVGVMLEAFADFSGFEGIEFQQDAYAGYHALEAESYTGNLLTNIFAGGTVDTERAFLTGMAPSDINYRSNTSSYVWYLKGQGYRASGDHPCNNWFYNRLNINSYLGFDRYRYTEDFFGPVFGADPTLNDYLFIPAMTNSVMEQIEDDAPLFSFSVTYQGHGPYSTDTSWWGGVDSFIANYNLTGTERTILANYIGSVMNTQMHLTDMVNTFRDSQEPIVVVLFGDHKPWLGNGNSVYDALGIDLSQETTESFYNYWSTRYLIWANDAAKAVIGHDMVGEGPDISPCFLMNVLFEQLGWEGDAYMQAVEQCRREVPVVHAYGRRMTAGGELVTGDELTQDQAGLVRQFQCLEYYRRHHFAF